MSKLEIQTDIPQVVNYVAATVNVGSTTTLSPGNNASVTNAGTIYNAILNFSIPRGESAYEQAVAGGYTGSLADFEALLAQLSDVLALMPKSGGTFTGDVTMDSGTSINFAHTKFYENNADNIVIGDGNGNGLVIMPNGQGAALFYNNGSDYTEVITSKDVKDTYSSTSSYPVSGKAVALAIAGKQDTISDLDTIRSGATAGATAVQLGDLATVATTGSYNDLTDSPSLAGVATSGDYDDLSNKPTIPANLEDLSDVTVTTPSDGDGLVYDAVSDKWKNGSFTASAAWGAITGTLSSQTDLKNALDGKQNTIANLAIIESGAAAGATAVQPGDLATVATTGQYSDLSGTPTIPSAINDLSDVNIASATDGQVLKYDGANSKWINGSASAGSVAWGGITGTLSSQTDLSNALSGKQDTLTAGTGITISSNTISTTALRNRSSATNSLSILGNPTTDIQATNIANSSTVGTFSVGVGYRATATTAGTAVGTRSSAGDYAVAIGSADNATNTTEATGSNSVAVGYNAKATASSAIQIGQGTNSTADTAQIGGTQIVDSNGKIPSSNLDIAVANTDLLNLTNAGSIKVANLSKPTRNVKATSLAVPAANTAFYAPADGYYCLVGSQNVQIISYDDNGNQGLFAWGLGLVLPVSKGQTCRINYASASDVLAFGFVYATGAESEAS